MRVEAQHLSLNYGKVAALRDLSVDVKGRVIGVLGPTASGKTSLLQIVAGRIPRPVPRRPRARRR
jgi:ABC-type multidrug transport system ATPase subunit